MLVAPLMTELANRRLGAAQACRGSSRAPFRKALDSDSADIEGDSTRESIYLGCEAGAKYMARRSYTGIEPYANALDLTRTRPMNCCRCAPPRTHTSRRMTCWRPTNISRTSTFR